MISEYTFSPWRLFSPKNIRTSAQNWRQPLRWNKRAGILQHAWEHGIALHGGDEQLCVANGFIKPQRPRVFCASLADVFDNAVDPAWRTDLFSLIEKTPHLDWLLLTKRIGNVSKMLEDIAVCQNHLLSTEDHYKPLPNVWIGATICNQAEADRDVPKLLTTAAAKRFLSIEPMLGAIDLTSLTTADGEQWNAFQAEEDDTPLTTIDWVIVGGESGHHARPMHPDWVRSLRDQCAADGVPFHFKQWGEWMPCNEMQCKHPGKHPDGRISDDYWFLKVDASICASGDSGFLMAKVGKKAAGRLLDGREWDEII